MSDLSTTNQRSVKLSKKNLMYLMNAKFLPGDLERIVSAADISNSEERVLKLDLNTAERFREELTNRLARAGFGPDYGPTHEGRLFEDLIIDLPNSMRNALADIMRTSLRTTRE